MKRSETKGAGVSHWARRDSLALSQRSQWWQKGQRLWYQILLWILTLTSALDSFSHFKPPVFSPVNEDCSHSPFPQRTGDITRDRAEKAWSWSLGRTTWGQCLLTKQCPCAHGGHYTHGHMMSAITSVRSASQNSSTVGGEAQESPLCQEAINRWWLHWERQLSVEMQPLADHLCSGGSPYTSV